MDALKQWKFKLIRLEIVQTSGILQGNRDDLVELGYKFYSHFEWIEKKKEGTKAKRAFIW